MNLAIDIFAGAVVNGSSLVVILCGSAFFAMLGSLRIRPFPSYALGLAVSFVFAIFATKGVAPDTVADQDLLAARVLTTLFYTAVFVFAYWVARAKLRPVMFAPARKPAKKKTIPQFAGMRHRRPKKPDPTPKWR